MSLQIVKPAGADLEKLQKAAKLLKKSNALYAIGKQGAEAAKAEISDWLKVNRKIDLDALPIGDFVNVEKVCMIERSKQNKFDEKSFLVDQPQLHEQYKRDHPITKFKAQIQEAGS